MNILFQNPDSTISEQFNKAITNLPGQTGGAKETQTEAAFHAGTDAVAFGGSAYGTQAYASHKSGIAEAAAAQQAGLSAAHNFDILLSNTLSEEDYAKARENGYDLRDTSPEETVTILDEVKAAVAKGGTKVAGFTDDLSVEQLEQMTGSAAFANELAKSFAANDIPLTEENVAAVQEAVSRARGLTAPDAAAVKYLVENNMMPTVENLYLASHSTNGKTASGGGFYAQDGGAYYAQRADRYDWEGLSGQIGRVVRAAGYAAEDEAAQKTARQLIEDGVPLTAKTFSDAMEIRALSFPLEEGQVIDAAASAIADGRKAADGNLADPKSLLQKAAELKAHTDRITDAAIDAAAEAGDEINLKNLIAATDRLEIAGPADTAASTAESSLFAVNARKQLEQVRLVMTTQANLKLLQSGFQIDTAPMEKLVQELQDTADRMYQTLFSKTGRVSGEDTASSAAAQGSLYAEATYKIGYIYGAHISLVGALKDEFRVDTLDDIFNKAKEVTFSYEKTFAGAEASYEALMTAPRADMGDSIRKAFRNVDDILDDLALEHTEDNRRAVRILGYNQMAVTKENAAEIRALDAKLTSVVEQLKPASVLDMIREGRNPLSMTLDELNRYLADKNQENAATDEKYAKFLYKLDHSREITAEERTSYIGIYRLFHTLQKTDGAAIGALLKTGAEMTVENLLTAVRTSRKASGAGIDVTVDDAFGGIDSARGDTETIDAQVRTAFLYYSAKADSAFAQLEPEKLHAMDAPERSELAEFADQMEALETDEALEAEYRRQSLREMREVIRNTETGEAARELTQSGVAQSVNNLEAMLSLRAGRRAGADTLWGRLAAAERLRGGGAAGTDGQIRNTLERLSDALGTAENYPEVYGESLQSLSDGLNMIAAGTEAAYQDIREISMLYRQLSVARQMADRGSYEVPVELDGQTVSMHVTLLRGTAERSGVRISMDTEEYGTLTANMRIEGAGAAGILQTTYGETPQVRAYLERLRDRYAEQIVREMPQLQAEIGNISILYGAAQDIQPPEADERGGSDRALFRLAEAFIKAI